MYLQKCVDSWVNRVILNYMFVLTYNENKPHIHMCRFMQKGLNRASYYFSQTIHKYDVLNVVRCFVNIIFITCIMYTNKLLFYLLGRLHFCQASRPFRLLVTTFYMHTTRKLTSILVNHSASDK